MCGCSFGAGNAVLIGDLHQRLAMLLQQTTAVERAIAFSMTTASTTADSAVPSGFDAKHLNPPSELLANSATVFPAPPASGTAPS